MAARLEGSDRLPNEHWLQWVIGRNPDLLRLRNVQREFPAFRPGVDGPARGLIDLVGLSTERTVRVHLLETKIGSNVMLVLQGLDYWIWAQANRAAITEFLEVPSDTPFEIDFVSSATGSKPAFGTHTASQAEALAGEIGWRFREVRDWFEAEPKFREYPRRSLRTGAGQDDPRRHTPGRFAHRLHERAVSAARVPLSARTFWTDVDDAIAPAARAAYGLLERQGRVHAFLTHVRSSQAFALNLFAPLVAEAHSRMLSSRFGPMASVEPVTFEFVVEADGLHERSAASSHTTQIDVVLSGVTGDGGTCRPTRRGEALRDRLQRVLGLGTRRRGRSASVLFARRVRRPGK